MGERSYGGLLKTEHLTAIHLHQVRNSVSLLYHLKPYVSYGRITDVKGEYLFGT